ncbi:hypothetical protein BHE74_00032495 [Ensete ventricosum]|nr:hypothetical protein BHE74_00032495 [Ensete ventricosum]RZR99245.1 hypothetical protein BHM03_00028748 [Ensete ventricosum]
MVFFSISSRTILSSPQWQQPASVTATISIAPFSVGSVICHPCCLIPLPHPADVVGLICPCSLGSRSSHGPLPLPTALLPASSLPSILRARSARSCFSCGQPSAIVASVASPLFLLCLPANALILSLQPLLPRAPPSSPASSQLAAEPPCCSQPQHPLPSPPTTIATAVAVAVAVVAATLVGQPLLLATHVIVCCQPSPLLPSTTANRRPRAPSTVHNNVTSASCYPCLPSLPSSSSSSAASAAPSATRSRSSSTLLQQLLPDINTTATHVAAFVAVMLMLQLPLPIASAVATIASCASSSPYAIAAQPSILHCTAAISAPHLSTRSLISNRSSHCFP